MLYYEVSMGRVLGGFEALELGRDGEVIENTDGNGRTHENARLCPSSWRSESPGRALEIFLGDLLEGRS